MDAEAEWERGGRESSGRAPAPRAALAGSLVSIAAIVILAVCVMVAGSIADSSRGVVAVVADVVFWGGAALLYFAPGLVAIDRRHPGCKALIGVNALVAWTGIGWLALLFFAFRPAVWSFGDPTGPAIPAPRKRCLNCRRKLGIEAETCFYCGTVQPDS